MRCKIFFVSIIGLSFFASPLYAAPPDFSGVWVPETKRTTPWPANPPYSANTQKIQDAYKANYVNELDDSDRSCIPYSMPLLMAGVAAYLVEVIQTPVRISILTEQHSSIRNIYLDGRAMPAELKPTHLGYSIGKWEGNTLVVESFGFMAMDGRRPVSEHMRVVERFSLVTGPNEKNGKSLVDEITIVDPKTYTKPIVIRKYFTSTPQYKMGEYLCNEDIWTQNLAGNISEIPWRK